ncbi:MAG: EAL domain-containing protein [Alphaproteobacteria bacterium]|nr:EAL domain-containing protein [Alphaproteobacteria bacterium]
MPPAPIPMATQEQALVDTVDRLERFRQGRRAVLIHLSKLKPHFRQEHHLRVAAATFETLINTFKGHLFRLGNGDVIVICQGATKDQMNEVITRLRTLFADDPLSQTSDDSLGDRFCTWYDLETQYDSFRSLAKNLFAENEERRAAAASNVVPPSQGGERGKPVPIAKEPEPMAGPHLGRLHDIVKGLDVTPLVRKQPICAVIGNADPVAVFHEVYVSIPDLQRTVMPQVNIASDRWIFQYLTSMLDRRMLQLLPTMEATLSQPCSVNLHVATLLSQEFLEFETRVKQSSRKQIIFELQAIDALSDMASFLFACDFARDRGYRLLIDGLNFLSFPQVKRRNLGVDLIKMAFTPEMLDTTNPKRKERIIAGVQRAGLDRVIMTRVDNEAALEYGASVGISLYQGRLIEQKYNEARKTIKVKNPATSESRALTALSKSGKV